MKLFKCKECGLLISENLDVCPKCNSKEQKAEENINCLIDNEKTIDLSTFDFKDRGYGIFISDGSSFYMPEAKHIEKIDEENKFDDDCTAAIQAEKDGIKLVNNMSFLQNKVYIDTPENRAIIEETLENKEWGKNKSK